MLSRSGFGRIGVVEAAASEPSPARSIIGARRQRARAILAGERGPPPAAA